MLDRNLPKSKWWEILLWLLRKRKRMKVTGYSMVPTLRPGEEVLIDLRAYKNHLPEIDDIVLAYHPKQETLKIIKRVASIEQNGYIFLVGDNKDQNQNTDSHTWGPIKNELIVGKVCSRFP